MTEPKILTPQEALRALAEGKKLTCEDWEPDYIYLRIDSIVDEKMVGYKGPFFDLYEYTEPKPKRKVAPYYVEYPNGKITLDDRCFETDEQARKYFETESVTRCMVLEREF